MSSARAPSINSSDSLSPRLPQRKQQHHEASPQRGRSLLARVPHTRPIVGGSPSTHSPPPRRVTVALQASQLPDASPFVSPGEHTFMRRGMKGIHTMCLVVRNMNYALYEALKLDPCTIDIAPTRSSSRSGRSDVFKGGAPGAHSAPSSLSNEAELVGIAKTEMLMFLHDAWSRHLGTSLAGAQHSATHDGSTLLDDDSAALRVDCCVRPGRAESFSLLLHSPLHSSMRTPHVSGIPPPMPCSISPPRFRSRSPTAINRTSKSIACRTDSLPSAEILDADWPLEIWFQVSVPETSSTRQHSTFLDRVVHVLQSALDRPAQYDERSNESFTAFGMTTLFLHSLMGPFLRVPCIGEVYVDGTRIYSTEDREMSRVTEIQLFAPRSRTARSNALTAAAEKDSACNASAHETGSSTAEDPPTPAVQKTATLQWEEGEARSPSLRVLVDDQDEITDALRDQVVKLHRKKVLKNIFCSPRGDEFLNTSQSGNCRSAQPSRRSEPHPLSPSRDGRPSSVLVRVSCSPLRSEDVYYIVGGGDLARVDLTVQVPLALNTPQLTKGAMQAPRGTLLDPLSTDDVAAYVCGCLRSQSEMLQYYIRNECRELICASPVEEEDLQAPVRSMSSSSKGRSEEDVSRSLLSARASGVNSMIQSVVSTIDVQPLLQTSRTEPQPTCELRCDIVCTILCRGDAEHTLLNEVRRVVSHPLLEKTYATAFRHTLREMARVLADSGAADLVKSVPASLRQCGLRVRSGSGDDKTLLQMCPHVASLALSSPVAVRQRPESLQGRRDTAQSGSTEPTVPLHTVAFARDDDVLEELTGAPQPRTGTPTPVPLASEGASSSACMIMSSDVQRATGDNHATLVLAFSSLPVWPLHRAMATWLADVATNKAPATCSPAELLLRACHFDLLDGLQTCCYDADDCVVSFESDSSVDDVVRIRAWVRCTNSNCDENAFRESALAMCAKGRSFGAIRDAYCQLCVDENIATDAIAAITAGERRAPWIDLHASQWNGRPLAQFLSVS